MAVDVIFDASKYGSTFEAIPIKNVEIISTSKVTTYKADKDCLIYQVNLGDLSKGDKGIILNGYLITGIIAGGYYLKANQSIDLIGDFLIIK